MRFFLPLLLSAGLTGDLMGPGVSRELAEYRAARIANVKYDLRLDVTARDSATGRVVIAFDWKGDGDAILDFRGTRLGRAAVNGVAAIVESNGAHIRIPGKLLRSGTNAATFDFVAPIAPSGASIIRFHDGTDNSDYLYTLLVPADANQLFPCFDQPDLKARVTLALTIPKAWSAVANGAVVAADSSAATVTTVRFAETEPISTYLIGFAAGPWSRVTRTIDGRPITLYVRASRVREADADSLIAINARAAQWLEQYFQSPFPFSKLDFVLAPAFPFGGMEHPGAIFYNEDRFIFRERPTQPQWLSREATIYHEIAHQWFGDLVTMRWFDDLWLKEGFATYMAAKMQAALTPSSDAWKTFYLRNKPLAYGVDRTAGTNAVWQPLANLDQAKSNYGPIVYNKAPGIIKQLDYAVGDSAFRAGLHGFLTTHAYANATWNDLLDAVARPARRSLTDWGQQYILRPGMPVIYQTTELQDGRIVAVRLSQVPSVGPGTAPWPIRTEVVFGYDTAAPVRVPVTLTSASVRVPLPTGARPADFVFANAGDYAYAAIVPDAHSAAWLARSVGTIREPLLRAMVWEALRDRMRDTALAPVEYLRIVQRELPREQDEQIVAFILSRTVRAATAYLSAAQRDSVVPTLSRTLRAIVDDGQKTYGIRKSSLDALIAIAYDSATAAPLDALLDGATVAGEPLRAPTRWAIVTALIQSRAPSAARRLAAETQRDSSSDGLRRAFIANAAHPTAETKRAYFTRYLSDTTLNEDWATASLGAFNDLGAQTLTIPYLRPALDSLAWVQKNRRIFFVGAWLTGFIEGQTSAQALDVVQRFLRERPLPDDLRRKVLQSMDELQRTVAIRRKYAGE